MFTVCNNFFLTLGKFQFSKRKSFIDHGDSDNINNKHQFYRLAKHQLGMCFTRSPLIWFLFKKSLMHVLFFLILTRALEHVVCLGESCLPQVNNSPRPNVLVVANFGKAMYQFFVSVSWKVNPGHPGWIFFLIWTNYCKLSRNFVGAITTTTNNCRVSFIDLYLIFPTNFRIVFLPHTNTVILLEPYCGTITEPGLPVITRARLCDW